MRASGSQTPKSMEKCQYLWGEYKYRHDLIWQRVFRFTSAVVLISVIPYIEPNIARLLNGWILIVPLLATILAGFVLLVMWNELILFGNIKKAYREEQNKLFERLHELGDKSNFRVYVLSYLAILAFLSAMNGYIVCWVWLPAVLARPTCAL